MSISAHNQIQIAQHGQESNSSNGIQRVDNSLRKTRHKSHRAPYLRAALMGANDGLISTASLLLGISASGLKQNVIILTGVSALISGSLSMFVGEYISVSSQRDSEKADIDLERVQHQEDAPDELEELVNIYIDRGLEEVLARQVAVALSEHDPVRVHVREELGIDMDNLSRPWVAAFSSGASFCVGAAFPLISAIIVQGKLMKLIVIAGVTLITFTIFGVISASLGGAPKMRASMRILFFGSLALGLTYLIGYFWNQLFDIGQEVTASS